MVTGPIRRKMVEIIANRPDGITNKEVCDLLYADDPNGGPSSASTVVSVLVYQANQQLAPHGLRIQGRSGRGSQYFMYETK